MLLDDKVAIVSGIGPGMGRQISLALARHGANLVIGARTESTLEALAADVEVLGRKVVWAVTDIGRTDDCYRLADLAVERFGRIDVLVNNAYTRTDFTRLDEAERDLANWRPQMDVNFFGTLTLTKAVIPTMKEQGSGRIVMINTMATQWIQAGVGSYAGSKNALAAVTKTLAVELGEFGIRVNGIHPGFIYGPNLERWLHAQAAERGLSFDEVKAEAAALTCLKYIPAADEIAGTVVFLASDLSLPITGQAICVNGGQWMA